MSSILQTGGKTFNRDLGLTGVLYTNGNPETINGQAVRVLQRDRDGNVLLATGTATISDNASGYAKGCLYIDTDVGAGTTGLYENVGTTTACNFDTIGSGGGGSTTFVGLTDTPANFTSAGNKIVKVNTGATALEFVTISGDVAMSSTGVTTVTDLTIASEAQGAILYNDGSGWEALTAGTNGYLLKAQGAAANPVWVDPSTLPTGVASGVQATWTMEAGTNDITVTNTTQTVGAGALTIPDFAGVADSFAFITLAQTLKNKVLDDASTKFGDTADTTKDLFFSLGGATTAKTMTIVSSHTDDRSITLPDATCTLVGADTTDSLSNKTLAAVKIATGDGIFDAGGDELLLFTEDTTPVNYINITSADTGVAPIVSAAGSDANIDLQLSPKATGNVHITDGTDTTKDIDFELNGATTAKTMTIISSQTDDRSLTLPDATDTLVGKATTDTLTNKSIDADGTGNVITNINVDEIDAQTVPAADGNNVTVLDGLIIAKVTNNATNFNIYSANAPYAFAVLDAWSINISADGGTWKLNNGAAGAGTDITDVVTVAASDKDIDRITTIDDAAFLIAASGSLSIVFDGGGALDAYIFIRIARLS